MFSDANSELAELQDEYRQELPSRFIELRAALKDCELGAAGALNEAIQFAHRLRGTGRPYGFPWVTDVAGHVEDTLRSLLLTQKQPSAGAFVALIEVATDALSRATSNIKQDDDKGLNAIMKTSEKSLELPHSFEAPITVLLVEDEVYYGKLIQRTLRTPSPQFRITWVTNVALGLSLMEEQDFDVILSDLELPDATRLESLTKFREVDAQIPVVILTAHADAQIGVDAIRAGADDFIIKERVSADSLVRSIRYAVERKKVEELRMRVEAIKDFQGMLAHDLRAPLIGAARVLECLEDTSIAPEDRDELIHHLRESNQHLLNLVTQLIEIYRLEASPPVVVGQPALIGPSLDAAVRAMHAIVQVKSLQVVVDAEYGLPPVFMDRVSLERVLSNLLDNACKFSPKNGAVTVRVRAVDDDSKVKIEVIDQGAGMSQDAQNTVFKRFWFGTPGKAYSSNGGLGLYLCHKLVNGANGTITFETSSAGTTFSITLNAARRI